MECFNKNRRWDVDDEVKESHRESKEPSSVKVLRFLQGRRGGKGGLEQGRDHAANLLICKEAALCPARSTIRNVPGVRYW